MIHHNRGTEDSILNAFLEKGNVRRQILSIIIDDTTFCILDTYDNRDIHS